MKINPLARERAVELSLGVHLCVLLSLMLLHLLSEGVHPPLDCQCQLESQQSQFLCPLNETNPHASWLPDGNSLLTSCDAIAAISFFSRPIHMVEGAAPKSSGQL